MPDEINGATGSTQTGVVDTNNNAQVENKDNKPEQQIQDTNKPFDINKDVNADIRKAIKAQAYKEFEKKGLIVPKGHVAISQEEFDKLVKPTKDPNTEEQNPQQQEKRKYEKIKQQLEQQYKPMVDSERQRREAIEKELEQERQDKIKLKKEIAYQNAINQLTDLQVAESTSEYVRDLVIRHLEIDEDGELQVVDPKTKEPIIMDIDKGNMGIADLLYKIQKEKPNLFVSQPRGVGFSNATPGRNRTVITPDKIGDLSPEEFKKFSKEYIKNYQG